MDKEHHSVEGGVEVLLQVSQRKGECKGQEPQVGGEYGLGRSAQMLTFLYVFMRSIVWLDRPKLLHFCMSS
jgi:hypothetical protein